MNPKKIKAYFVKTVQKCEFYERIAEKTQISSEDHGKTSMSSKDWR